MELRSKFYTFANNHILIDLATITSTSTTKEKKDRKEEQKYKKYELIL